MVNKRYTKPQLAKLIKELTGLRKGEGLVPSKLQSVATIRAVVAQLTRNQPDSLTNHRIYNFLLEELAQFPHTDVTKALRSAFGLVNPAPRLSIRRKQLSRMMQKHTDTIERYENQAIANFAAHLLEKEADAMKGAQDQPSYVGVVEKQNEALKQLASISLSTHLSLDSHASNLLQYLESSRKPYLNATVALAFLPSSRGSEWYRFKLTYGFQGVRETYRIAVVLDNKDGERLMEAGLIDDFHKLNDPSRLSREISSIIANSKFILKNSSAGMQKLLRLNKIDVKTSHKILRSVSATLHEPCWLLEVAIPFEWQSPEVSYEYQSIVNLSAKEHYAYWYSPGLMYLKKLTFDFSHFPGADSWHFFLQPFLGHASGVFAEEARQFTFQADSWIMPGHGIALIWQEKV